jgi:hypothetical protein
VAPQTAVSSAPLTAAHDCSGHTMSDLGGSTRSVVDGGTSGVAQAPINVPTAITVATRVDSRLMTAGKAATQRPWLDPCLFVRGAL